MAGLADFEKACQEIAKNVQNAGHAAEGTIQGSMVNVNGQLYPYEVAVPINVHSGSRVWVHLAGSKAVVIGG